MIWVGIGTGVDDDHQVARLLVVAVDLEWSGAHVASVSLQALPLDASSNFGRWVYIDIDRTNYSYFVTGRGTLVYQLGFLSTI